jgi:hypothetical protein
MVACVVVVAVLVVLAAIGTSFAQQGGESGQGGGQPAASAPAAPMGGPASGPPGMALPKDTVKGETTRVANPAKTSKIVWIIAAVVVLAAIVGFAMSRKKSA